MRFSPKSTLLRFVGITTATAVLPVSTLSRAAPAVEKLVTVRSFLSPGLLMAATMTDPARTELAAAGAPTTAPESPSATATLVAAMEKLLPPPKARPSSAANASGANSIMESAGTLRMVLRRSLTAIAKTRLMGAESDMDAWRRSSAHARATP